MTSRALRFGLAGTAAIATLALGLTGAATADPDAGDRGVDQHLESILAAGMPPAASAEPSGPPPPSEEELSAQEGADTWTTLSEQFPAVAATQPANPAEGRWVQEYLSPHAARVTADGGKSRILLSTVPLRTTDDEGTLARTDFTLTDAGDSREPENAPFHLSVSETVPGEFRLGPRPADAVGVRPVDVAAAEPVHADADTLFWDNTHELADTLVTSTAGGVESFEQLRGPEAPDEIAYDVDVPDGAELVATPAGGAVVRRGTTTLVEVAPPSAEDAAGLAVAVTLRVEGHRLTVVVGHRRSETTYPVLVDPQFTSTYDWSAGSGLEGWGAMREPNNDQWYHAFGTADPAAAGHPEAAGLWLAPRGGKPYTWDAQATSNNGPRAQAFFIAPGAGTIQSITYRGFRYSFTRDADGKGDGQAARLAVYPLNGTTPLWGRDYYGEDAEANGITVSSGQLPPGAKVATLWLFTANCGTGQDCTYDVGVGTKASWTSVNGVEMVIDDPDAPSVEQSGELVDRGARWLNAGNGELTYRLKASDGTSGLSSVGSQSQLEEHPNATFNDLDDVAQPACDPDHHTPGRQGAICSQEHIQDLRWDPRSVPTNFAGWVNFRGWATDHAGNTAFGGTSTVWIDRDTPKATFSGTVVDEREQWVARRGGHTLRLTGTESWVGESGIDGLHISETHQANDLTSPTTEQLLDRNPCPTPTAMTPPPATWRPCGDEATSPTLTMELKDGSHVFTGQVEDFAGNPVATGGTTSARVFVDATRPKLELSGSLAAAADTWGAPSAPLSLAATTSDNLSGVADVRLRVVDEDDLEVLDLARTATCPTPAPTTLKPCEPTPPDTRVTVAPEDLPSGHLRVIGDVTDYAGNTTTRDFWMHVDRKAPTVDLAGPITRLANGWHDPERPIEAVVSGEDDLSGIRELQLWARGPEGDEHLMKREVVCDEAPEYSGDQAPCPLTASTVFQIAPSEVGDGRTTFFARAVEFAGHAAQEGVTVTLDQTDPEPPTNVRITMTDDSTATVRWDAGKQPTYDVGLSHYVMKVTVDNVVVRENISPYPYATIGGIPDGLSVDVLVKAVDKLDRESKAKEAELLRKLKKQGLLPDTLLGWNLLRPQDVDDYNDIAKRMRPYLLFDSSEKYRPLNVPVFLRTTALRLCSPSVQPGACQDMRGDASLMASKRFGNDQAVMDQAAAARTDADGHRTTISDCWKKDMLDCEDRENGIYYSVVSPAGPRQYIYVNYWFFYRYNDVPFKQLAGDLLHEGDWEGVTVVVEPSSPHRLVYAAFTSHGSLWRYLRRAIHCGPKATTCSPGNQRVTNYVAQGTHANYPFDCGRFIVNCKQTGEGDEGRSSIPEAGHDGNDAWRLNGIDRTTERLPRASESIWSDWPGSWNENPATRVRSPAYPYRGKGDDNYHRYSAPWAMMKPTNRLDERTFVPSSAGDAEPQPSGRRVAGDCLSWAGPGVAASLCDEDKVARAISAGALDAADTPELRVEGAETADGNGLSQAVGAPLTAGRSLTVSGRAAGTTELRVRLAGEDGESVAVFRDLGLEEGGTATVTVEGDRERPTPRLRKPNGRVVAPAVVQDVSIRAQATVRVPVRPRGVTVRRAGARTIAVSARSNTRRIAFVVARSCDDPGVKRTRTVAGTAGGVKRTRLRIAAAGRAAVRVTAIGEQGQRSGTVCRVVR